jgi:hypothetical protein
MPATTEDAGCLCEAARRGGIVLTVESTGERAGRVKDIPRTPQGGPSGRMRRRVAAERLDRLRSERRAAHDLPDRRGRAQDGTAFDPASLNPRKRTERRESRAVRSYIRVR